MQILWINIIMDGPPAQSLGVEPVDKVCLFLNIAYLKQMLWSFIFFRRKSQNIEINNASSYSAMSPSLIVVCWGRRILLSYWISVVDQVAF